MKIHSNPQPYKIAHDISATVVIHGDLQIWYTFGLFYFQLSIAFFQFVMDDLIVAAIVEGHRFPFLFFSLEKMRHADRI
ncbi:hypothetical protein D3C71_1888510 [compost metagenome]